jgi:hypothetical protein
MAFKKVAGRRVYYKFKDCTPGQVLVNGGRYIGPEQGKYGIQHIFLEDDGTKTVVLNSSGHLNWLLENYATSGKSLCNVIYSERVLLTKGAMAGKEAHNFELEIDDGDNTPVVKHKEVLPESAKKKDFAGFFDSDISL